MGLTKNRTLVTAGSFSDGGTCLSSTWSSSPRQIRATNQRGGCEDVTTRLSNRSTSWLEEAEPIATRKQITQIRGWDAFPFLKIPMFPRKC